eukprot:1155633-Pelagomonas_calceolata.AAC.1
MTTFVDCAPSESCVPLNATAHCAVLWLDPNHGQKKPWDTHAPRGTSAKPAFHSIPLSQQHIQQQRQRAGGDGSSAAEIVLQAATGGVLLDSTVVGKGANGTGASEHTKSSKAGKLQHSKQDVTVLGPENQMQLSLAWSTQVYAVAANEGLLWNRVRIWIFIGCARELRVELRALHGASLHVAPRRAGMKHLCMNAQSTN